MIEVHIGTRPGRPALLLAVSAALLIGTLGLAWLQVARSRGLGPELRVPGTPLVVRPPRGWIPDPDRNRPGSFVLPVRREVQGQEVWEADRRIQFEYERWPAFRPLAELLATEAAGEFPPEPARIGRFDAVQLRRAVRRRWGRQVIERESILRVACLPGGQLVKVVYLPMTDLTLADLRLFDRICAATRIDEPTLNTTPEAAARRAGVEFPFEPGAAVELPGVLEAPGLFVGGSEGGFPAWSLGVFRTWLAAGRTPRDLLQDYAVMEWLSDVDALDIRESARADGAKVTTARRPDAARDQHPVASVWVIAKSPAEAVMLFVYTNGQHFAGADAAAQRIADQIRIAPLEQWPTVESAEAAGRELATLLTRKGALPWWGRRPISLQYRGTGARNEELVIIQRDASPRDPNFAYQGSLERRSNRPSGDGTYWQLDAQAVGYVYRSTAVVGENTRFSMQELRPPQGSLVQRVLRVNDAPWWSGTFQPGPSFICPPIESIAEAWVARKTEGFWIVQVDTTFGRGAHTRLLRPLPPEGQYTRVLLQDDYRPLGTILAYDEDGELRYETDGATRYERVR